jgi:hypothetical protein
MITYHRQCYGRSGGADRDNNVGSAYHPAKMTEASPSVTVMIRRWCSYEHSRSSNQSGGVDGGTNIGLAYYAAVNPSPLPPYYVALLLLSSPHGWFHITNDFDRPSLILHFLESIVIIIEILFRLHKTLGHIHIYTMSLHTYITAKKQFHKTYWRDPYIQVY